MINAENKLYIFDDGTFFIEGNHFALCPLMKSKCNIYCSRCISLRDFADKVYAVIINCGSEPVRYEAE